MYVRVEKKVLEFLWDNGNSEKNLIAHNVTNNESEESFFDEKRVIFKDILHSGKEERFRIIGKTKKGRLLFIAFTMRGTRIRIISARDINRKEVYLYEKTAQASKV